MNKRMKIYSKKIAGYNLTTAGLLVNYIKLHIPLDAEVTIDDDDLKFYYSALETDEEYKQRVKLEENLQHRKETQERLLLAELKAKYENN